MAASAPWCTLCYADLRPKPAEPAEPVAAVSVPQASSAGAAHTPRHAAPAPTSAPVELLDESLDRPIVQHADALTRAATWPCAVCHNVVPIEENVCPGCGSGFLAGASAEMPAVSLPGVGDVRTLTPGGKIVVIVGGAAIITVGLLLILALVGQVL